MIRWKLSKADVVEVVCLTLGTVIFLIVVAWVITWIRS